MTDDSAPPVPDRPLGLWLCLALVVGNFIGSGIFLLPAQLAPFGWNALFGWLVTIAGALCLAFVFARLSAAIPLAAGPYAFVGQAFGPAAGFAVGWGYWIALWVGNAAIAIAAISYASLLFPELAQGGRGAIAAVSLVWLLTLVNCTSVRAAGGVQAVTTLIKLLPLIAVIAIAFWLLAEGRAVPNRPFRTAELNLGAINGAAALALWAMLGVECASVATRKVRDPARTVPLATMVGTLFVGIVYLLVSTPVTMLLPAGEVSASNAPVALFVERYWTPGLGLAVGLAAAISCAGALNGFILLQGELPFAMARQGSFPAFFARLSRNGIAVRAQLVSSLLATLLILANAERSVSALFAFMALLATAATLFLYFGCALAALRLQRTGAVPRSLALKATAAIGALFALWTFYGAGFEAVAWGLVLLAAGAPVFLLTRRAARSIPEAEAARAEPRG